MPTAAEEDPRTTSAIKFKVLKSKLNEALNQVIKSVSSKTTMPILTGIKLTASQAGLTLIGSNSDISIRAFIPCEENGSENAKVDVPGSIVLPALFADLVRKLPEEDILFDGDSRRIATIHSGPSEFSLNGLDPEEYPNLPVIVEKNSFYVKQAQIKEAINQTVFSVSTAETRPVLTGVRWMIDENSLLCVATDSHRLAQRTIDIEPQGQLDIHELIIPGSSLNELNKIIDSDGDEPLEVMMTAHQILFKIKHVQFYSRLLDGNYPDTNRLIPSERKTTLTLATRSFYSAIERASLLAKEEKNNIVKMTTQDQNIEISSQSLELGRVFEEIHADQFEGENLRISFSAKFMMDALSRIDAQKVRIDFVGPMRPIIVRPISEKKILMLILPIRTF
ncbi:MAG: DNA polymerase III subunit beta [Sporolactobacillus sp.]